MNEFKILDTPESFELKVPIRKYWIPMFLFGMSTIAFGGITIILLLVIVKMISFGDSLEIPMEAFFQVLLFPIFLNLAMWFIFGYEKIIFTNDKLEIIKSNRIFSRKKIVNLCEINSVEIRKNNSNIIEGVTHIREMRNAMFFWRKMGKIILKTNKSKITILNGLQGKKITEMKTLIENEIEKRCSK